MCSGCREGDGGGAACVRKGRAGGGIPSHEEHTRPQILAVILAPIGIVLGSVSGKFVYVVVIIV